MANIRTMTFLEIRDEVADMIRDTGADRASTIDKAINRKLMMIGARFNWQELARTENRVRTMKTKASVVADQDGYTIAAGVDTALPISTISGYQALGAGMAQVHKVSYVDGDLLYDMTRVEPDDFDLVTSSSTNLEGYPEFWCMDGFTPMAEPLLDTAKGSWSSSETSDTGIVRISYRDNINIASAPVSDNIYNDVTLAGSEAVSSRRADKGWSIKDVVIASSVVGTVSGLYANSAISPSYYDLFSFKSSDLSDISGTRKFSRSDKRPLIRVWPNPSKEFEMVIHMKVHLEPLIKPEDVPMIPVAGYLVEAATASIFENLRLHDIAQVHNQNAEAHISSIIREQALGSTKTAAPLAARGRTKDYYRYRR